jgi:phosphate transport system substrate-binding protein
LKVLLTISFAAVIAATSLLPAACVSPAAAMDISGAGAPHPIFIKWADTYQTETGTVVNYYAIGSSSGIKQLQNGIVTFGVSDMPLKADQLNREGLIQFPIVIGGTVPVVNLQGIKASEVRLNGTTLAKIFLGQVKTWHDPEILNLNPSTRLPSDPLVVVHRSDDIGTSFIWTNYLSKVSPEWKLKVGENTSVEWPTGIGANGNEGMATTVQSTKGAIGYLEYVYAKQSKLTTINMINRNGKTAEPSFTAFQAAAPEDGARGTMSS